MEEVGALETYQLATSSTSVNPPALSGSPSARRREQTGLPQASPPSHVGWGQYAADRLCRVGHDLGRSLGDVTSRVPAPVPTGPQQPAVAAEILRQALRSPVMEPVVLVDDLRPDDVEVGAGDEALGVEYLDLRLDVDVCAPVDDP